MTDISAKRTPIRRNYNWRVVDIVVAALIAVAGGVIFWAWSQGANLISAPVNALYPPLTGLYAGGWMIPAVLGMLIIRKPGAALFCETVAATGELIMGSQYGTTVLFSGILQGLGAELVFAAWSTRSSTCRWRCWPVPAQVSSAASTTPSCPGAGTSPTPAGTSSPTSSSPPSPAP